MLSLVTLLVMYIRRHRLARSQLSTWSTDGHALQQQLRSSCGFLQYNDMAFFFFFFSFDVLPSTYKRYPYCQLFTLQV